MIPSSQLFVEGIWTFLNFFTDLDFLCFWGSEIWAYGHLWSILKAYRNTFPWWALSSGVAVWVMVCKPMGAVPFVWNNLLFHQNDIALLTLSLVLKAETSFSFIFSVCFLQLPLQIMYRIEKWLLCCHANFKCSKLHLKVMKMISLKFRRLTWSTIKEDKEKNLPLYGLFAFSQTNLRDYRSLTFPTWTGGCF